MIIVHSTFWDSNTEWYYSLVRLKLGHQNSWSCVSDLLTLWLVQCYDFDHYRPTPNEIFQLGKRVLVTGTPRTPNDYIFADMTVPGWDKDTMKYFTPYPTCGGYRAGDWYIVGGESQMVGPICESSWSIFMWVQWVQLKPMMSNIAVMFCGQCACESNPVIISRVICSNL